jgi:putative flippase GtrA
LKLAKFWKFVSKMESVKIKYVAIGALNFLFSYLLFVVLWQAFNFCLSYKIIALLCTTLGATFSYFMQWWITWGRPKIQLEKFLVYILIQYLVSLVSIAVVPRICFYFALSILYVQLCWSLLVAVMIFFISKVYIFQKSQR